MAVMNQDDFYGNMACLEAMGRILRLNILLVDRTDQGVWPFLLTDCPHGSSAVRFTSALLPPDIGPSP